MPTLLLSLASKNNHGPPSLHHGEEHANRNPLKKQHNARTNAQTKAEGRIKAREYRSGIIEGEEGEEANV